MDAGGTTGNIGIVAANIYIVGATGNIHEGQWGWSERLHAPGDRHGQCVVGNRDDAASWRTGEDSALLRTEVTRIYIAGTVGCPRICCQIERGLPVGESDLPVQQYGNVR